jgi:tetrahydromethanopterin S-methyltransferase subunit H
MFKFKSEQKIFQIGKVKVGGQPGENPTVLIGTIFYTGHKIVQDHKEGVFDREEAKKLILKQDELSDKFGLPCMLDVVGVTDKSMIKFIDFVAEVTDTPFLIDAMTAEARIAGAKHVAEVGLSDRAIYNSIMPSPWFKPEEIDTIKNSKIRSAILLAYNTKDRTPKGVISLLKGGDGVKGLLSIAEEANVDKPLVDTTLFTYVPSIGVGAKASFLVKDELGLPVGGAPGNATTVWRKEVVKNWGMDVFKACDAAVQASSLTMGTDFLLYGVIESAPWIFPACAAVNAMIAANSWVELGIKPREKTHPLFKLFPQFVEKLEKAAL